MWSVCSAGPREAGSEGPLESEGRIWPEEFCLICCWWRCMADSCASICSSICSCAGFRLARLARSCSSNCSFCGVRYQCGTGVCADPLLQESVELCAGLELLLLRAGLVWAPAGSSAVLCGGRAGAEA